MQMSGYAIMQQPMGEKSKTGKLSIVILVTVMLLSAVMYDSSTPTCRDTLKRLSLIHALITSHAVHDLIHAFITDVKCS